MTTQYTNYYIKKNSMNYDIDLITRGAKHFGFGWMTRKEAAVWIIKQSPWY